GAGDVPRPGRPAGGPRAPRLRARAAGRIATAVAAALLLLPAAATARVPRAETVLPPGQSGYVPLTGDNPHLTDQLALFESFQLKPAGFDLPGTVETPRPGITITRDAYGV